MIWLAAIVGGGLVWNAVDSFGGLYLGSFEAIEGFSYICGFVLAELMMAGLVVVKNGFGNFAHAIIQGQLAMLALVAACLVTRFVFQGKLKAVGVTFAVTLVYGFIHFKLWQWAIPNTVQGESTLYGDHVSAYLSQMGLPPDAVNSAHVLRENFNQVSFGGTAIGLAVLAFVIGVLITGAFMAFRPQPAMRRR